VVTYGICYEDHLKKEMGRETEGMQKKGRKWSLRQQGSWAKKSG
jgi:hypothetical protein